MTSRSRLLRWYPSSWRDRYGDDLTAYLDDTYPGRLPFRAAVSLVAGGLRERVHCASVNRAALSAGARVRAGVLTVLAAWAAFVLAGSSLAKISEHFDTSLPQGAHATADMAYTIVQLAATASGLVAVAGLILAVPSLLRFLSGGGWRLIRRHVARAAAASLLTAGLTVAVAGWAHHLTQAQRNGGDPSYSALFLLWAGMVAVTITLWTVATVSTARRLTISRHLLLAEGALATVVTTGMLIMLVAAAVWWAAMATSAPSFFGGDTLGLGAGWNPQLVGTLTLMLAALASAVIGVIRIARSAPAIITTAMPPTSAP